MTSSGVHIHDILNTSDHLLDISSEEHESLTHHPSLLSAYESELQFDESTFQHETEPYKSQVADSADMDGTSGTDRGDNSHTELPDDPLNATVQMKREEGIFSSSPVDDPESDEDKPNPYSSYQQFHRDLSNHDDDPKSELLEFETLEQEIELTPVIDNIASFTNITDDVASFDSLRKYLHNNRLSNNLSDEPSPEFEMGMIGSAGAVQGTTAGGGGPGEHRSRRDHWVDNSTSDVSSISKQGKTSPSRIPKATNSPVRSQATTPSGQRSRTPSGIPTLKKSQSLTRERSPSATRRSPAGGEEKSGRRSVSADTKNTTGRSGIASPRSAADAGRRRRILSGSMIPRSRPVTPSSSLRSLDRQSSSEPRSEISESASSRPASRLPKRARDGGIGGAHLNISRSSVEPRIFQNQSSKPSRLPSAHPSVTSATELTSQDEQSPDLDLSSEEEAGLHVQVDESFGGTFLTQPNNSLNIRNPPSSDTQPLSTMFDTHDQVTSMTDRSATEAPHPPPSKHRSTRVTTKTTLDYEEVETTKKTTRIVSRSPSNPKELPLKRDNSRTDTSKERSKSLHNANRLRQAEKILERRALSEARKDSPSQFGEAKALNDAIRMLEARETKDNKSSTEKSSWSPTLPDDMGDNSRPMSSTWTSLAEFDQSPDTKPKTPGFTQSGDAELERGGVNKVHKHKEDMPRTSHTHLPGAVNHAHYALPTTSYLSKLQTGRTDSSSSDVAQVPKKKSPRKKRLESDQFPHSKLDQSDAGLDTSTKEDATECEELVRQLQTDFDDLLSKYAMAEVTIDQLRLGAKLNMYADPALPSQATVIQPSTARSATTLTLPHKGQASLNSSLQSATFNYNYPGLSPRQPESGGPSTTSPSARSLTDEQRALAGNIIHLQDQVASFISGVSGEGRILNLKPEIHHQLYEALEQSQDTLHHQLIEEKRSDPSFDTDNQLAGHLHQIRMSMDDQAEKLPALEPPSRANLSKYTSEDETVSQTPSSMTTGNSGSTSVRRPRRSHRHSRRSSRQATPQGSRQSPSYTEHSSSVDDDMLTDDETVRPRAHLRSSKDGGIATNMRPQAKGLHAAASNSSVAGSDHTHGIKSQARLQGSSDSGFIGSEEGKSPNTPERHLAGLPTIQSQAENSGIDSPRALTPDLSESRTAEWALRHKVPIEVGSGPVLPEPPNSKRAQSRSSKKSVRSERSAQSSLKSEALQSMKSEIERLRDDFSIHQQSVPSPGQRQNTVNIPKQSFGSPMRATYQLPPGYQSHSPLRPQASSNKAETRNSDLDLSEVEGGRGYTPAPNSPDREGTPQEPYPSAGEDPMLPLNQSEKQRKQQQRSLHRGTDMPLQQTYPHNRDVEYPPSRSRDQRRPDTGRCLNMEPGTKGRIDSPLQDYLPPSQERRRTDAAEYFPRRAPSSLYDYRPYDKQPHHRQDVSPNGHRHEYPTEEGYKQTYDEPDYRGQRSQRGQRPVRRDDTPHVSEQAYHDPEREYYRRYKAPIGRSQQYHDDKPVSRSFSQTMPELNTGDLNQTSLPMDSTVYTNPSRTPNIPPPNAISTPYHPHTSQSQHSFHSHHQPQASLQPNSQLQQPLQHNHSLTQPSSYTNQQPPRMYHQSVPVQRIPIQPPAYHQPSRISHPVQQQLMTSHPVQQQLMTSHPVQHTVYQNQPVQQTVVPTATVIPTATVSYQACPSCDGKGLLATSHSCTMCGSQIKSAQALTLTNQMSAMQLPNGGSPVVIPVTNENHGQAYLTQETVDGGYLTQSVNVLESADTRPRAHSIGVRAVPVMETSPSGKVRYYVREYGAIPSDSEPRRSRSQSRRRRSKSSDRYRGYRTSESMDDLENSLREARRSAESLKRLSKGMRDGLHEELMRSLHRKSLTSSWNL